MRVTADTLGAWVIKCNPAVTDVGSLLTSGDPIRSWCVTDNYRTALMDAGQPAVFWVSGRARGRFPRGIWGIGCVRAAALASADSSSDGTHRAPRSLVAQLDIAVLDAPIAAGEMASIPALRNVEVLRQPFMSNPSWLSKDELSALRELI